MKYRVFKCIKSVAEYEEGVSYKLFLGTGILPYRYEDYYYTFVSNTPLCSIGDDNWLDEYFKLEFFSLTWGRLKNIFI